MFPIDFLKQAYEHLSREPDATQMAWSGPIAGLAEAISRLPGVEVVHLEHGSVTPHGSVVTPRLLVALADPYTAALIGMTIQRPGTHARTSLEWIIRHAGDDDECPWFASLDSPRLEERDALWWVHPLDMPSEKAAQLAWLKTAHEDYGSGEVLCAYIQLFLEGELATRLEDERERQSARRKRK